MKTYKLRNFKKPLTAKQAAKLAPKLAQKIKQVKQLFINPIMKSKRQDFLYEQNYGRYL